MTFFQVQFKKLRYLVQLLSRLSLEIRPQGLQNFPPMQNKSLLGTVQMCHLHSD